MKPSATLSLKRSGKIRKGLVSLALVLSFVGFADAAYLTIEHYRGAVVPCDLTGGCETVLTSKYAVIGGVPLSLFGTLYYLALFFAAILYVSAGNTNIATAASWLTLAGLGMSVYLVYLQLFVINAICPYCMVSAGTSTALFVLGAIFLTRRPVLQ